VTCVASVLAVAIPMWNFTRRMLALESRIGLLIAIAGILVGYVFTAIVPLFYFALYRNKGDLSISRNMRRISITAAGAIGILSLAAILRWIAFSQGDSVLDATAKPWTTSDTAALISLGANVSVVLLLSALFRLAGIGSPESGIASKFLDLLTKVAVVAGGIVAVGCVVGLAATPWVYSYVRDWSSKVGSSNAPWTFSGLALDRIGAALNAMSVYVAPFVIWQGSRPRIAPH